MKAPEFNQLKKSVSSRSPKQKTDLEKYFLDPKSQPKVIKFLKQALAGCPHCQNDATYRFGVSKGARDTAADPVEKPKKRLLGPY